MLDTFKARLKAKTKAAGVNLSQKRIDAFADRLHKKNPDVTEEAAHDELIDALDELVVFKDVAKDDDKMRTTEAKLKTATATPPKKEKPEDEDEETEETEETPTEKKSSKKPSKTQQLLQGLLEKVEALTSEKQVTTTKAKLKESLKDIPASFYEEWAIPEKDEEIEAFETKVKTKWEAFAKEHPIAPGKTGHQPFRSSGADVKASEKDVKEIVDSII